MTDLETARQAPARPHHCLTDPEAGFPRGMPDVGRSGLTGDCLHGPFTYACRTCGERYVWREVVGFVVWFPEGVGDLDTGRWCAHVARVAAAVPSATEARGGW